MEKDTFEQNMQDLEEVVKKLESGNLSLESAITEFEKGIKLSKVANKKLETAEKKINILLTSENGDVKEEEFTEE